MVRASHGAGKTRQGRNRRRTDRLAHPLSYFFVHPHHHLPRSLHPRNVQPGETRPGPFATVSSQSKAIRSSNGGITRNYLATCTLRVMVGNLPREQRVHSTRLSWAGSGYTRANEENKVLAASHRALGGCPHHPDDGPCSKVDRSSAGQGIGSQRCGDPPGTGHSYFGLGKTATAASDGAALTRCGAWPRGLHGECHLPPGSPPSPLP